MERIGIDQRRARLGLRHRLAGPAGDPVGAASGVVALHATDPASVYLSVGARTASVDVEAIERALYQDRSLIRMMGMRRTMFVVPTQLAPVIQAACADAIAVVQRRRYTRFMVDGGVGDAAWVKEVEEATVRALAVRGSATGAELAADEPRLRTRLKLAEGKSYATEQGITSWILYLLGLDARIVGGRPRGSWISSQYRWSPMENWLPGGLPRLAAEPARIELVRQCAPARAGSHPDGLDPAVPVPRGARAHAVRPDRQRRTDGLE